MHEDIQEIAKHESHDLFVCCMCGFLSILYPPQFYDNVNLENILIKISKNNTTSAIQAPKIVEHMRGHRSKNPSVAIHSNCQTKLWLFNAFSVVIVSVRP